MPPKQLSHQAKEAIALAAEGIGGLPALIRWAKNNTTSFYTLLYVKLLPFNVAGTVDVDVNDNSADLQNNLQQMLEKIIRARREEAARTGIIDAYVNPETISEEQIEAASLNIHSMAALLDNTDRERDFPIRETPNPPAPPPPPAPTPVAAENTTENVVRFNRAVDNAPPRRVADQPPPAHPAPPTSTDLFYEYHRNGGGQRMWWGPTGEGGPP